MAALTEPCPDCGTHLVAGSTWCITCGWTSAGAATSAIPVTGPPPTGAADAGPPTPSAPQAPCTNPGCGALLAEATASCPYCGHAQGPPARLAVRLELPWGPLPLGDGEDLALGRLPSFSPFHAQLGPHHLVGRRHAVVRRRGDRVLLTDQTSRNGTFRNGVRVAAAEEVELADGDTVSLAGEVTFRIRIERS